MKFIDAVIIYKEILKIVKILALDIGDVWVGVAISDAIQMTCRPLTTLKLPELEKYLEKITSEESLEAIVIGYPITMSGTQSEQTKKVIAKKEELEKFFESKGKQVKFVLWDERLSSKRAWELKGRAPKTKEEKLKEHSIAASYILQNYLDFKALSSKVETE